MSTRTQLIDDFAAWLIDAGHADTRHEADRKAWDFVAGAYKDGDTLENFQNAWEDTIEQNESGAE